MSDCPRPVTVRITQGQISVEPANAKIDRNCQIVRWNLTTDDSLRYKYPPLSFPWPAPEHDPPYTRWPEEGRLVQTGPRQWEANANKPLSGQREFYYYQIETESGILDPDIENDPYPPAEEDPAK